jgi:hypothetical protein
VEKDIGLAGNLPMMSGLGFIKQPQGLLDEGATVWLLSASGDHNRRDNGTPE